MRRAVFLRNPKWQIVVAEVLFIALYAALTWFLGGAGANQLPIAVDFLLFTAGLFIWTFFFSQFTLPVRTAEERRRAFSFLIRCLFGWNGPIYRVENGQIQVRDPGRRGCPGVAYLDAASAAVVRTDVAFTRTIGPGVTFLEGGGGRHEFLAGAVDLHPQVRTIGPETGSIGASVGSASGSLTGSEDPFAQRNKDEGEEAYAARQIRRWETSGLTRDGIEVVPNVSVAFRLDARPGEGGSGFGYNTVSVWRAITGGGVDPNLPADDARRHVEWDWLAARLAADAWREYLRMFTMDELFLDGSGKTAWDGQTACEIIASMVRARLTQAKVAELSEFGRPTGRQVTCPEFTLLMRRGVRVQSVRVFHLRFPAAVEDQLIRRWRSSWLNRARQERDLLEYQRAYAKEAGQRAALMEFAQAASHPVGDVQPAEIQAPGIPPGDVLLKKLVEGTLSLCVRDPQLHQRISLERTEMVDLLSWVNTQRQTLIIRSAIRPALRRAIPPAPETPPPTMPPAAPEELTSP
jgi:hypothetical protein